MEEMKETKEEQKQEEKKMNINFGKVKETLEVLKICITIVSIPIVYLFEKRENIAKENTSFAKKVFDGIKKSF